MGPLPLSAALGLLDAVAFLPCLIEEGNPLPVPNPESTASGADLIELIPLSVHAGSTRQ